jgi:hypothetical protein
MGDEIPLYNTCLSQADLDLLMEGIRSTSYIDEIESGEQSRQESDLWNAVLPVKEIPKDTSIASLIKDAGSKAALVIANDKQKKSVLVVQIKDGAKVDEYRVVPKDVIEVCCSLRASSMNLSEVSIVICCRNDPSDFSGCYPARSVI